MYIGIFFIEFLINLFHFLGLILPIMIIVAFVTLLERKEIATMQKRRGPNVIGLFGLLQPFADGLKLLLKEPVFPYISSKEMFIISPIITFSCSLISWSVFPMGGFLSFLNFDLNLLLILSLSSLSIYGIVFSGWSSNSKYAFLGALRSTSQFISYEVSFTLSILPLVIITQSVNLETFVINQSEIWNVFLLLIPAVVIFISILAETNRLPFDLPEAEAELVSGYNVEYSAMFFAFFYLAEYLSIILMSTLFVILFFGGWLIFNFTSFFCFSIKVVLVIYIIIWIRVTFPRYRFDQLLQLGWKCFLPIMMGFYLFTSSIFLSTYLLTLSFI